MVPVDANVPFVEAVLLNLRDCLYAVPSLDANLFLLCLLSSDVRDR